MHLAGFIVFTIASVYAFFRLVYELKLLRPHPWRYAAIFFVLLAAEFTEAYRVSRWLLIGTLAGWVCLYYWFIDRLKVRR